MATRSYDETAFYDFDRNYDDAVELYRRVFGEARAEALQAAKGRNTRSDFITAISWGWLFHRPLLSPQQRALVLIGNDAAKLLLDALRDHAQWGLAEGLHREKVREAIFTLSIYSGLPVCERAMAEIEDLFASLDEEGWQPAVPPGPLPEVTEHPFYAFEQNYRDGVELSISNFGEGRGGNREARLARMGASAVGDFQAIHWGWMMHRPFLEPSERSLVLLGSDSANKGYLAMKDHVRWGLKEGLTREQIQEAMLMLNLFNGWPANREANVAINDLFAELDKQA